MSLYSSLEWLAGSVWAIYPRLSSPPILRPTKFLGKEKQDLQESNASTVSLYSESQGKETISI